MMKTDVSGGKRGMTPEERRAKNAALKRRRRREAKGLPEDAVLIRKGRSKEEVLAAQRESARRLYRRKKGLPEDAVLIQDLTPEQRAERKRAQKHAYYLKRRAELAPEREARAKAREAARIAKTEETVRKAAERQARIEANRVERERLKDLAELKRKAEQRCRPTVKISGDGKSRQNEPKPSKKQWKPGRLLYHMGFRSQSL